MRTIPTKTPARLAATAAGVALVLTAVPASAHVSVSSPDAAQEGYGKLVFRVPNESEDASTNRLTITLPTDTPFASLSAGTKPGWEVEIERDDLPGPVESNGVTLTEAPRTVTWTATGDGVAPGEFDEFSLSGGPFPAADDMTFEAEQTYDDGEVVDWAEVAEGDTEPERPAPALALAASTGDAHGGAHDDSAGETTQAAPADGDDLLARVLGGVAAVLAAAALVVAVGQNRRRAGTDDA